MIPLSITIREDEMMVFFLYVINFFKNFMAILMQLEKFIKIFLNQLSFNKDQNKASVNR